MKTKKIFKHSNQDGFNLVELMVSVGIMCFLMAISAPSFSGWIAALRVRATAEGMMLGIAQARGEAIRRNKPVSFVLDNNKSWQVIDVVEDKVLNRKDVTDSSLATTAIVISPGGSNTITFGGFGSIVANTDGSNALASINVSTTTSFSGIKNLRVKVSGGGATFICDPGVADANDTRYCRGT